MWRILSFKMKSLLIFLCATFATILGSCTNSGKGLEFQKTIINFGQAKVDDDISVAFVFKNKSDDHIIISDITYDCNCISFSEYSFPYKVPPHTTDSLIVKIDAAVEGLGFKSKNIAVRTSSGPKLHLLKVEGEIL